MLRQEMALERRVKCEMCQASHAESMMRELEATGKKNLGETDETYA